MLISHRLKNNGPCFILVNYRLKQSDVNCFPAWKFETGNFIFSTVIHYIVGATIRCHQNSWESPWYERQTWLDMKPQRWPYLCIYGKHSVLYSFVTILRIYYHGLGH